MRSTFIRTLEMAQLGGELTGWTRYSTHLLVSAQRCYSERSPGNSTAQNYRVSKTQNLPHPNREDVPIPIHPVTPIVASIGVRISVLSVLRLRTARALELY
jgi:hypothetical protein